MKPSAIGRGYQDLAQSATSVDKALDVIGENLRISGDVSDFSLFFCLIFGRGKHQKNHSMNFWQSFAVEARKIERLGSEFGFGSGFSISGFFRKTEVPISPPFCRPPRCGGRRGTFFDLGICGSSETGKTFPLKIVPSRCCMIFRKLQNAGLWIPLR